MATNDQTVPVGKLTSVPNMVTMARIVLTVFCFVALSFADYGIAFVLFVVAAGTDWVDGWWARRFNQVSQIGRVLDPFADKLLICGVFVFLAAVPSVIGDVAAGDILADGESLNGETLRTSGIVAWMAVVVMAREILVTALRSFVEAQGGDFSAKWLGKLKMVLQCVAVGASLLWLSGWWTIGADYAPTIIAATVWGSIVLTVWSGWGYIMSALQMAQADSTSEASDA